MAKRPMFDQDMKYVLSFSGGQDSTTCFMLLLSMVPKQNIYPLSFAYGQSHNFAEAHAQEDILCAVGIPMSQFLRIETPSLGMSALTGIGDVNSPHPLAAHLPASFVPGRNLLFTVFAAQYAHTLGAKGVVLGVNAVDYSGYPDCRPATMRAMEDTIKKGMDWEGFQLLTPLISMSKQAIVEAFYSANVPWLDRVQRDKIMGLTHTCYRGIVPGCGECPSCKVREAGFASAGVSDPRFKERV